MTVTSGDDTNANISDKTGQATQRNCLSKQLNYLIFFILHPSFLYRNCLLPGRKKRRNPKICAALYCYTKKGLKNAQLLCAFIIFDNRLSLETNKQTNEEVNYCLRNILVFYFLIVNTKMMSGRNTFHQEKKKKKTSETRMTASVLKQDPIT